MTQEQPDSRTDEIDVLVVGAGPAGLSAALVLGRCRRRVVLCDAGEPRNQRSAAVSGYLSRDGCPPEALRRTGREEIAQYPCVSVRDVAVQDIAKEPGPSLSFLAELEDGSRVRARRVVLATGLRDDPPDIPGAVELFGRGVWTCPYCDGWELRDQPLAVYGPRGSAIGLALELRQWTTDLVLLTGGEGPKEPADLETLAQAGIAVVDTRIEALEPRDDRLAGIRFVDGSRRDCAGLFYVAHARQRSPLVEGLGCELSKRGTAETSTYEQSSVPGVFVVGDASRRVQFAIVAAAEGAMAAFAINTELIGEDFGTARSPGKEGTGSAGPN